MQLNRCKFWILRILSCISVYLHWVIV